MPDLDTSDSTTTAPQSPDHQKQLEESKKPSFSRAHQFLTNPPLTISQIHPSNPLHQFDSWFRDPRLPPSTSPETCTLATALLPSGRVSARVVYLKELDERGWVVYSNWGSREGKGRHVFGDGAGIGSLQDNGVPGAIPRDGEQGAKDDGEGDEILRGNKWAALTFNWANVERQVRIEGLVEPLTREESEMYWRTRERDSQIGAWASWQSKVLWSTEQDELLETRRKSLAGVVDGTKSASAAACTEQPVADIEDLDIEDGPVTLEQRMEYFRAQFSGVDEIPLPPFWGGVRLVPESVEFWQGRRSRLHDRFRYVRVHQRDGASGGNGDSMYRWKIQRLSP